MSQGKGDSTGETAGKAAAGEAKKDKTLEEITLEMLEQLGASVRPARNVPNVEALSWVLEQLRSSNPPSTLDMEWFSMGDPQVLDTLIQTLRSCSHPSDTWGRMCGRAGYGACSCAESELLGHRAQVALQ